MLKLRHTARPTTATTVASATSTSLLERPELRIRDLRDDPRLRRAMGLDDARPEVRAELPAPRFDRRRLLDDAAA